MTVTNKRLLGAFLAALTIFAIAGALLLPSGPVEAAADEATVKVFKAQCATCHGLDGKGDTTVGKKVGVKDWTDGKTLKAMTDADIKALIRSGKKGDDGKERMPSYTKLSDDTVVGLVKYVRSFQ